MKPRESQMSECYHCDKAVNVDESPMISLYEYEEKYDVFMCVECANKEALEYEKETALDVYDG